MLREAKEGRFVVLGHLGAPDEGDRDRPERRDECEGVDTCRVWSGQFFSDVDRRRLVGPGR
jgi:hypothetical protein